jgi:hypothetical protein
MSDTLNHHSNESKNVEIVEFSNCPRRNSGKADFAKEFEVSFISSVRGDQIRFVSVQCKDLAVFGVGEASNTPLFRREDGDGRKCSLSAECIPRQFLV